MFKNGIWSIMVAAGIMKVISLCIGIVMKGIGAIPKEHLVNPNPVACIPIIYLLSMPLIGYVLLYNFT
jgi:hypothetical protein